MSIRKAALFVSLCLLTSCGTQSAHPPKLPPDLCTQVERPQPMPEGASIVQPVTEEERAATALLLNWVGGLWSNANHNADRAERAAKEGCE